MAFFNQLAEKTRSFAGSAGKKTETAVELSKASIKLNQLENQLKKTFERIGTLVYEESQGFADNGDLTEICIRDAAALEREIRELNEKIKNMKEKKVCPVCGLSNPSEKTYCENCGTKL